jgi:hypothetical protein
MTKKPMIRDPVTREPTTTLKPTDDRPFFVCNPSHCDGFSYYPGSLFLEALVALPFPLLPCFAMCC